MDRGTTYSEQNVKNNCASEVFAVTWFNNAYSAIVKVKLFVCIGEMISFRYGTRIPANLTQ